MYDLPLWGFMLMLTTERTPPVWFLAYAVAVATCDPSDIPLLKIVATSLAVGVTSVQLHLSQKL